MEQFEKLLNRSAPQVLSDIPSAYVGLPMDCDPPTRKEIYQAIKQLKNGKSAGLDSIPAETLKRDVETSVELLYPLFKKIWEEEQVPSEWKESYVIEGPVLLRILTKYQFLPFYLCVVFLCRKMPIFSHTVDHFCMSAVFFS